MRYTVEEALRMSDRLGVQLRAGLVALATVLSYAR